MCMHMTAHNTSAYPSSLADLNVSYVVYPECLHAAAAASSFVTFELLYS